MSLLTISDPAEITFRHSDTTQTRVKKLELLRQWIIEQIELLNVVEDEPEPEPSGSEAERVRAWWKDAPVANQTLIIWPFAEDMTLRGGLAGAVGFLGGTIAAPVEIEIYRNPTFTGNEITGGEVIGTLTIDETDNSFSFATVDDQDYLFEINDVIAAKWPNVTEASADAGAFVLPALFGHHATYGLLLEGDQQVDGEDCFLLEGDQTDGDDILLIEGS